MSPNVDLFGNVVDEFADSKEKYGIWPFTVWDVDVPNADTTKKLRELIGDDDTQRHDAVSGTYGFQDGASVFSPAIAAWILNLYAPKEGICFDPFAGGGTRAIMAAKYGLDYIGCEIRKEEVDSVRARCTKHGVNEKVSLLHMDARSSQLPNGMADFSFTCPPYFNLEQYKGGPNDLSMAPTYMHFCSGISAVFNESIRILKSGSIAVWVVGLLRAKNGELIPLNHDMGRIGKASGFYLKEEIILQRKNSGAGNRVVNFERGNKFLARTHEYALVFVKP